MPGLFDILAADGAEKDGYRIGTVTSISPLTVQLGAGGLGIPSPALATSILPNTNDVVLCLLSKGRVIVQEILSGGSWRTFTATCTGFSNATTTVTGFYTQIGKTVHYRMTMTLGTVILLGSATINMALPVTASSNISVAAGTQGVIGVCRYRTAAGNVFLGEVALSTTTQAICRVPGTTATSNLVTWTGAAPAGQVVGDIWSMSGTYEAA